MSAIELVQKSDLPEPVIKRGITEPQWRTLFNLYPGARPDSALMVWDYCKSRQLDPMKKPCHIVPMRVKVNGEWAWRDVVMPGIYEYRTTAQRTGLYLGHTEPVFGEPLELLGVKAPAWCAMTFYRWNEKAQEKVPFPVKVWFAECVGTKVKNDVETVNERWTKAPIQMLTKCTEAAGLREAFPEEFGGEPTAEEMDGQRAYDDAPVVSVVSSPKPSVRKSEQSSQPVPVVNPQPPATSAAPEPQPEPPATAPANAPAWVGMIVTVDERPGGTLITLSSGFKCATRNADLIAAAKGLRDTQAVVELSTRAAKQAGNAPILESIEPVGEDA
jgi:phage recombination protein Bet